MHQISIKEKIIATHSLILSQAYLKKILEVSGKKYDIDTLIRFGYISVIKKGESYYNLLIRDFKNPYVLGDAYMGDNIYMFGGLDRYNKEGFSTQISNIFTIYNTQYSRKIHIVGVSFVFKKVKEEFLYGIKTHKEVSYMDKERLFLEYVRDYINYEDSFFIPHLETLNTQKLKKYTKKYPVKKVIGKINSLLCI